MKKLLIIYLFVICFSAVSLITATEVTYVASEAVYINSGTNNGIILGDSLKVYRNDSLQAVLIVTNTASTSCACSIAELFGSIQAGDIVDFQSTSSSKDNLNIKETKKPIQINSTKSIINNIDGYISIQNYYQKDMTGSSLSYSQPSLVSKLRVENILNRNWTFSIRHRSRFIHRVRSFGSTFDKNDWSHRIYNFALSGDKASPWQWSLGRQSVAEVRGIGFIDGLTIQKQLTKQFTLGVASGFEPDRITTDISFDQPKAGIYLTWKDKLRNDHKIRTSLGFAGSYYKNNINREFLALGSSYYYKQKISLFASSEIDFNRSWRKEKSGNYLSFTNIYLNFAVYTFCSIYYLYFL